MSVFESRTSVLERVRTKPRAQVLIVGGGINGLSTLRELAFQGVEVTLVEKNDYCSGASAASSHMIHGGIRYLENGEFRLVRESLLERNRLLSTAPHYVKPLKTTMPIFSVFSGVLSAPFKLLFHRGGKPKERGALLIKIGLLLYDTFGRNAGTMPRHEFFGRKRSLRELPAINPEVKFTAHYFDAAIENPERLALDILGDALAQGEHVRALNYVEASGATGEGIVLTDTRTGENITFEADLVINAAGPWTDRANRAFGLPSAYLGGTKGSHIVLDNPELFQACDSREIFFENSDGRIVLMYPLLGRVIVGTTDIPLDNPDEAECTEEEVEYFFDLASHVFPDIALDRRQIVYRYSGVRPLPAAGDVSPGVVSRDYRIVSDRLPTGQRVLSLIGGKWTTFRALGEHLANDALEVLGQRRSVSTVGMAIGGGKDFPRDASSLQHWVTQHRGAVPQARAGQLLVRYGTTARDLLAHLSEAGDDPLVHIEGFSSQEVAWLVHGEHAVTLADIVFRRTLLGFTGSIGPQGVRELAQVIAPVMGWSAADVAREVASIRLEQPA
ncbi:glycerol-3-phosphate dehydrogenase/oxidase [Pontimonas sp.]|nr:glycerol-3-phosphate dehydrogenase/oxidase [Pontimonas sp.]